MRPLYYNEQGKEHKLVCAMHKQFPPIEMSPFIVQDRGGLEEQRSKGFLKEARYQQILTWEKVCGLQEMSFEKCVKCPNCRFAENHPIRGEQLKSLPQWLGKKK